MIPSRGIEFEVRYPRYGHFCGYRVYGRRWFRYEAEVHHRPREYHRIIESQKFRKFADALDWAQKSWEDGE